MNGGSDDMTLAFELSALKELESPEEVFTDARQWTNYVGVISEEPTYAVTNFTRKHRIRQDFFSGPRGREESLVNIKTQFESERYVLVGTDEDDEQVATETDWEYVDVETAADAAEWQLASDLETPDTEPETHDDWP
jgi:hypothetical protein